jgi:thioredoxin reductase (NADPH)
MPGWSGGVGGAALARRMAGQVAACPATVERGTVVSLRPGPGGFAVGLEDGRCLVGRTVCVASGTRPAPLPWKVAGHAMPARDVRDLPRGLAGRRVVVIGGGDAAFDTALTAADRGAEVVVLVRGVVPRAAPGLLREAAAAGIDVRNGVFVAALACSRRAWRVVTIGGDELTADHVVACIGRVPRDDLVRGLDAGVGVFVAGDVHRGAQRFAALAMGDGQAAALAAATAIRAGGDARRR